MPPFIPYMCCKQLLYEFALIPTTILQGGKLKSYRKHLTQNQTLTKTPKPEFQHCYLQVIIWNSKRNHSFWM